MVPEASLKQTEHGLAVAGEGWFVLNAREALWLGIGLVALRPGEPNGMYHWETDQEDFLVLSGEALLIVEGEERPLRQWDFVHCPPETQHVIVGAGDGPCLVLAIGARERHTTRGPDGHLQGTDDWGAYTVDEAALRHGAGVEEETTDAEQAYARFAKPQPTRCRDGWLPG